MADRPGGDRRAGRERCAGHGSRRGGSASSLTYVAGAGETNTLRVTQSALTVGFDDDVAITTSNPACAAAGGNVTCTVRRRPSWMSIWETSTTRRR